MGTKIFSLVSASITLFLEATLLIIMVAASFLRWLPVCSWSQCYKIIQLQPGGGSVLGNAVVFRVVQWCSSQQGLLLCIFFHFYHCFHTFLFPSLSVTSIRLLLFIICLLSQHTMQGFF